MNSDLIIPVIYENQEILIINKKQGLAVQGGEKIKNPLDKILPEQLGYPVYLVHRLDMETAGLMVVAKSPKSAAKWTDLISRKEVIKEYNAICSGCPDRQKGVFSASIMDRGVKKTALTYYDVVSSADVKVPLSGDSGTGVGQEKVRLSLLHLTLGTGRMHQIRIHLSENGFPIAGDDKHGDFKLNRLLKKSAGIKRLMLASVRLTVPVDGKPLVFEIPLPDHMKKIADSYLVKS